MKKTCSGCRWWTTDPTIYGDWNICRRVAVKHRESKARVRVPPNAAATEDLLTQAEFGCVQWEKRG